MATPSAWKRLTAAQRRRIVLGGLVALSLAARDLVLFSFAGGLLALSEMTAAPASRPSAS